FLIDLGGNDNGMALRFQSNALQAGIASGSDRVNISQSNIAGNSDWNNGGWNHIAFVYNVNNIRLFVNGVQKATANLGFNAVGSTTNQSRIGGVNGTNAFNSTASSSYFSGF